MRGECEVPVFKIVFAMEFEIQPEKVLCFPSKVVLIINQRQPTLEVLECVRGKLEVYSIKKFLQLKPRLKTKKYLVLQVKCF